MPQGKPGPKIGPSPSASDAGVSLPPAADTRSPALSPSEAAFAFALETTHTGIWDLDEVDGTAFRSLEHDRIFGYQELLPEWTLQTFLTHVVPEDRDRIGGLFRASAETGCDLEFECQIQRTDGELHWIWAKGRHRVDEHGHPRIAGVVQDITSHKNAEEALAASEHRYRALLTASSAVMFRFNADWSQMLEIRSPGYVAATEMPNPRWIEDYIPAEDQSAVRAAVERATTTGEPFDLQHRVISAAGSRVWMHSRAVVLPGESGHAEWFGYSIDISKRKRAEEDLRESEARANALIKHAPTAIYTVSFRPPRFIEVNEVMSRLSGYSREELLAMSPFDLLDKESQKRFQRRIAQLRPGRTPETDVEYTAIRKDGGKLFIVLNVRFTFDKEGKPDGAFVIGHDVTHRRAMEEALRESEARFRSVLENSLDAAYRRDLCTDCYDYVSPVIETITGYTPEEFAALTMEEVFCHIHPDDVVLVSSAVAQADKEGRLSAEYRFRRKDGSYAWLADNAVVSDDGKGCPRYRSGVVRDITHHKQVEQDLHDSHLREAVLLRENLSRVTLVKELATTVASSLDPKKLAEKVLGVAHDLLGADVGAVYLLRDPAGPIDAVAHFGYSLADGAEWLPLDESTLCGRAILSGRMQTASSKDLPPRTVQLIELNGTQGRRWACAPVKARDKTIGGVLLGFPGERPFGDDETALYRAVGDQLGVGLENARLYEAEHHIAETLQETLVVLPRQVRGIAFSRAYESATYQSGRVGGDFVDVFETHHPWVGITLGDVSGKGIDAAVTTSLIRNTLRVHAIDGLPVSEVVSKSNQVMHRSTDMASFVTLWFGLLNTSTGQLRYVCAGHPPALVLSQDGRIVELKGGQPLLGAYEDVEYWEQQTALVPGDRLLLYSDGVTEARSAKGKFLDSAGLLQLIDARKDVETAELASELMRGVIGFSEGILRDDAAILAIEPVRIRPRAEGEGQQTLPMEGEY
ncbi:MAG: PAS domain S-box protein [Coriobacteriia bacterium]